MVALSVERPYPGGIQSGRGWLLYAHAYIAYHLLYTQTNIPSHIVPYAHCHTPPHLNYNLNAHIYSVSVYIKKYKNVIEEASCPYKWCKQI